jgi:cytochrome oxidase Cu insertion factor (SCO1/SenC/PrrC family)
MNYRLLLFVVVTAALTITVLTSTTENIQAKNQEKSMSKICIDGKCTVEISDSGINTTLTDDNMTKLDDTKLDDLNLKMSSLKSLFESIR